MIFLKKHKRKIISAVIILALLIFTYMWGGNTPPEINLENKKITLTSENKEEEIPETISEKPTPDKGTTVHKDEKISPAPAESVPEPKKEDVEYSVLQGMDIDKESGTDRYKTQPVPEGMPVPIEPQTVTISDKQMTCTLAIRCDTLLNNLDYLEESKRPLVPQDGIILAEKQVTFYEGESVFNVLLRETRRNGIHMEYVSTPIYNSAYIEGIHNLYEFDCGELSGWMYSVNGWFPNYGCSRYALKEGDRIEWVYTCKLGRDVK